MTIKPIMTNTPGQSSAATPRVGASTAEGGQFQAEQAQTDAKIKSFEAAIKAASEKGDMEGLKKTAQEFEEIFVNMLLKSMRSTVGDSGLMEKSNQRDIFEGMLDEELAKTISKGGGIGISEMMVKQLSKYAQPESSKASDSEKESDGLSSSKVSFDSKG